MTSQRARKLGNWLRSARYRGLAQAEARLAEGRPLAVHPPAGAAGSTGFLESSLRTRRIGFDHKKRGTHCYQESKRHTVNPGLLAHPIRGIVSRAGVANQDKARPGTMGSGSCRAAQFAPPGAPSPCCLLVVKCE